MIIPAIAAALLLLAWWVFNRMGRPPESMEEVYRADAKHGWDRQHDKLEDWQFCHNPRCPNCLVVHQILDSREGL